MSGNIHNLDEHRFPVTVNQRGRKRATSRGDKAIVENGIPLMLRSGSAAGIGRSAPWTMVEPPLQRTSRNQLVWLATRQERASLARVTVDAQLALKEAVLAATEVAQRTGSLAVVLEEALGVAAGQDAIPAAPPLRVVTAPDLTQSLSPREQEVLAMVAEGHSNKAIAEALYVSPNTIKTHVASLLNKLQAGSRVQLAAIAARQWCGRTDADAHSG